MNHRKIDYEKLTELYRAGYSIPAIKIALGATDVSVVYRALKRIGARDTVFPQKKWTEEEKAIVKELREQGQGNTYIARVIGCSAGQVKVLCNREGYKPAEINLRKDIAKLYREGHAIEEIALQYGWDTEVCEKWMKDQYIIRPKKEPKVYFKEKQPKVTFYRGVEKRICRQCGKDICRTTFDEYVYIRKVPTSRSKDVTLTFCSWSCMRAYDREHEAEERKGKKECLVYAK